MSTGKGRHLIRAADLYCGGGGFSRGLLDAIGVCQDVEVELLAINHWHIAIATHSLNHPGVRHMCEAIEGINPQVAVPGGKLDILLASPECTFFSGARGGKPMSDQSRASAWCVLRWLEALDVRAVILENVPEWEQWGPLHPCTCGALEKAEADGIPVDELWKVKHTPGKKCLRPIEKLKGKYFRLFIRNLRALGYKAEWKRLVAANYGDATTRERFFLIARKDKKPIVWPEPTHAKEPETVAQPTFAFSRRVERWRPARECIDFTIPGVSIYASKDEARKFGVKRPLAANTLRRIFAGLVKFSGLPFLMPHQHGNSTEWNVRDLGRPFPTITGTSCDMFLTEPFLVVLRNHVDAASVDDPLRTICAGGNHLYLAQPCIIGTTQTGGNGSYAYSADRPLPTITTQQELALIEPLLAAVNHGGDESRCHSLNDPLRTLTGKGTWSLIEPTVLGQQSGAVARPVSEPLPTIAGAGAISLAEFLVGTGGPQHAGEPRSIDEPLGTVLGRNHRALVEPWMVDYYGEREGQAPRCRSVDEPMPTVAGSRTHGLCDPYIVEYYGNGQAHPLDLPMPTVTCRDRFALVHPELVRTGQVEGCIIGWLDIRLRMLKTKELAAAMSFPKTYVFRGTQEQQVKQVGNAVPVRTARALCEAVLKGGA